MSPAYIFGFYKMYAPLRFIIVFTLYLAETHRSVYNIYANIKNTPKTRILSGFSGCFIMLLIFTNEISSATQSCVPMP